MDASVDTHTHGEAEQANERDQRVPAVLPPHPVTFSCCDVTVCGALSVGVFHGGARYAPLAAARCRNRAPASSPRSEHALAELMSIDAATRPSTRTGAGGADANRPATATDEQQQPRRHVTTPFRSSGATEWPPREADVQQQQQRHSPQTAAPPSRPHTSHIGRSGLPSRGSMTPHHSHHSHYSYPSPYSHHAHHSYPSRPSASSSPAPPGLVDHFPMPPRVVIPADSPSYMSTTHSPAYAAWPPRAHTEVSHASSAPQTRVTALALLSAAKHTSTPGGMAPSSSPYQISHHPPSHVSHHPSSIMHQSPHTFSQPHPPLSSSEYADSAIAAPSPPSSAPPPLSQRGGLAHFSFTGSRGAIWPSLALARAHAILAFLRHSSLLVPGWETAPPAAPSSSSVPPATARLDDADALLLAAGGGLEDALLALVWLEQAQAEPGSEFYRNPKMGPFREVQEMVPFVASIAQRGLASAAQQQQQHPHALRWSQPSQPTPAAPSHPQAPRRLSLTRRSSGGVLPAHVAGPVRAAAPATVKPPAKLAAPATSTRMSAPLPSGAVGAASTAARAPAPAPAPAPASSFIVMPAFHHSPHRLSPAASDGGTPLMSAAPSPRATVVLAGELMAAARAAAAISYKQAQHAAAKEETAAAATAADNSEATQDEGNYY